MYSLLVSFPFFTNCFPLPKSSFDPDPAIRHSFWTCVVGGCFTWLSVYGANQAQIQRAVTCSTLRKAQLWDSLNKIIDFIPDDWWLTCLTYDCSSLQSLLVELAWPLHHSVLVCYDRHCHLCFLRDLWPEDLWPYISLWPGKWRQVVGKSALEGNLCSLPVSHKSYKKSSTGESADCTCFSSRWNLISHWDLCS